MSVLGSVNPIPGLPARLATLTRAAIFMQYETGFNPDGTPTYRPGWESLGSSEKVELKLTPTFANADFQDRAMSTPMARDLVKVEATISLTLTQMSPLVKALQIMAADPTRKYTQAAAVGSTRTLTGAVAGLVYRLGYKDVTVTGITWGKDAGDDPIALVAGTDYTVDRIAGEVYLRNKPAAWAEGDPVVSFTAPAIDATANLASLSGLSSPGIRGRFKANGRNVNGFKADAFVWDLQFSSESTIPFQNSSTEFDKVELSGTLFAAEFDDLGRALPADDAYFTVIEQSRSGLV